MTQIDIAPEVFCPNSNQVKNSDGSPTFVLIFLEVPPDSSEYLSTLEKATVAAVLSSVAGWVAAAAGHD